MIFTSTAMRRIAYPHGAARSKPQSDRNRGHCRSSGHHGQRDERAIWFDRGLAGLSGHGTRGHVDMIAAFVPDDGTCIGNLIPTIPTMRWRITRPSRQPASSTRTVASDSEGQHRLGQLQLRQPLRGEWLRIAARLQRSHRRTCPRFSKICIPIAT